MTRQQKETDTRSLPVLPPSNEGASETCCGSMDRRTFIKWAGAGAASVAAGATQPKAIAGPFNASDVQDHFVPADKKLQAAWLEQLFARGERTWYSGRDLETIAMPIGGICTGQMYLAGDGRLMNWDIFNKHIFTGYGRENYQLGRTPLSPLAQGFAVQVQAGEETVERTLDIDGFPAVRFCGEYPIGMVEYGDPSFPVEIRMQAYSPFIPLNEEDSALPTTILQFSLKNRSEQTVAVKLVGWLENAVCRHSSQGMYGVRRNQVVKRDGMTMILGTARSETPPESAREPIVLADFEGDTYGDWTVEGDAFGERPASGTLDSQQEVSGFRGKGLVNTYLGGDDDLQGKLTSPEFTIERGFLSFLIGGGKHEGKTCINLLIGKETVRTAVGKNNERLTWHNWDVRNLEGKTARIEIVDRESSAWGHINIDQIELRDQPVGQIEGPLEEQADFGSMGLALLDNAADVLHTLSLPDRPPADGLFSAEGLGADGQPERPFGQTLCGAIGRQVELDPGAEATLTFAVCWFFPNRDERGSRRGNYYARRFEDAADVAAYISEHFDRLSGQTLCWHDTWYDSTLPYWLLDRLFSTTSTLATSTCQWWGNGRFWAWEGVGCCHGTCTHVWNYEHTMARLFPQLERSVREMQDYNPEAGFDEQTGMIRFRGEGWDKWAGDGQAGSVLKAYREHLVSKNGEFLQRNWPRIKKSLQFLIDQDGDQNGLLEGSQHNTYDIDFFGPNTMVGSLYLASLRAGEAMAEGMGDQVFAEQCRRLYASGSRLSVEGLFNGEYFVQLVDLEKHPKHQYGDGCLADQLFGQGWAHQVGLGYIYPKPQIEMTLEAIWKYCWAPDVGPQNDAHLPERWFARPGEAGLFTCTWPKSPHLAAGVRYKNEVWTGIEYQVAGNLAWEGMVTEALAICRGIHERYHPAKRNPWNEVECGDHYARGMASHGVFLGLCGFEYDGPNGHLGFAPRIDTDDFRAAFTAAEGWGTLSQQRTGDRQKQRIEVKWGSLVVRSLAFEVAENASLQSAVVSSGGETIKTNAEQDGRRIVLRLEQPITVAADSELSIEVSVS